MKGKTKRKLFIIIILSVSVAIMFGLTTLRTKPEKKPVKDTAMLIDALKLETSQVTFEINSQGTVKPRTQTDLSAEVSGRIIHISNKFVAGGVFKKGEVLMQIDPVDYQVAVTQSEALLKQRQIEFDGAKSLRKKGYRAEAELAAAQTALAVAKAAYVKAKINLDRTKIRLPYDGMVKSKDSDLGQFVNRGNRLGTTFAINTAEIRLALIDQDLAFLDLPETAHMTKGKTISKPSVTLSAIRKGKYQEWSAQIIRTEGIVDEKSRVTFAVAQIEDPYRLFIDNNSELNDEALPIGTFVKATIKGNSYSNVIKIPRTAIRGKNELLFIDESNHLHIRKVNILRTDTENAYILDESTQSGERISITAIESPINGMKVRTSDEQIAKDNQETSVDNSQLIQSN